MIIINNEKVIDLDFSFWLNNQLTMKDIYNILETSDLSEEQKSFKNNYKKFESIEGEQERWYSLEEATYIINGNYFLTYNEDIKKRNVTLDFVKNKTNNILNNIKNGTNQNCNEYHYPQKRKFPSKKIKYVNESMIDEILRDDVTKPEKIEFGNLPSKELLPNQDKIVNYIQGFKHIHNKKLIIDYLNQLSITMAQSLDDLRYFSNRLSRLKDNIQFSRKIAQNIHRNGDIDTKEKYDRLKAEYSNLLKRCIQFSNKYLDIIDIKNIFNIYDTRRIVINMSDNVKVWDIPDINNEQIIKDDLKKFVNLKKEQYLGDARWSRNKILEDLNEIEVNPTTSLNGTTEMDIVAEWMYKNKTKVAHDIINRELNTIYELLNGMLKAEYTQFMIYIRTSYDLAKTYNEKSF
ncbi:hypothetical protein RJC24_11330 [Staphylococcus epidermidis]|uniref:hypothetical protein n=1 Tax=Staphylococcus epidermidis TaxID=1282 RepID=UPI002878E15F|nr:hypothetical protein [Staphylococcus epidermidis]MDS3929984.1 hypothetical protein [Staphylococcus epidermidis]